jgi:hypothetical protein
MHKRPAYAVVVVACVALVATACESTKSSNPLSPTVAGPIPGVDITAPKPLDPQTGSKIAVDKQPITLLVENASTSGVRPLSYVFEVATDANFTNKVFTRDNIAPGDGGRTSLRLPDPLTTGRTYYWHSRAQDGANTGSFSTAAAFDVFTPIVIQDPGLVSPAENSTVDSIRPRFTINNVARSGPVGNITYLIEIADSDAFTNKIASFTKAEQGGQGGQTTFDTPNDLAYSKVYFWHVRAFDPTTTGPFSRVFAFVTPAQPVAPPPSAPGPGGPAPAGFGVGSVTIVGGSPDIRSWPVTSTITSIVFSPGTFHIDHTKRGQWPGVDIGGALQESTIWVFENINGQWYGTGGERLRPGQTDKGLDRPSDIASGWFYNAFWAPMTGYVPRPGETVGFMVTAGSTRADSNAPVKERSGIVLISFPSDGGGSYPPFLYQER